MPKRTVKKVNLEEVLILDAPVSESVERLLQEPIDDTWSPGESLPRYVVVRSGLRVSDKDYPKADEPRAIAERDFWRKVIERWPDGTKIEIVQYDKKRHRVW
jgi:hypothetical protein